MADIPVIPLEVLLGNPEKSQPKVSPDGERMSYIAPVDGVLNVWVGNVKKGDYAPITKDTDRGVRAYSWVHDNRHLVYIQDQGGDENWRVYKVDLEKGETTDLTPFDGVQARVEKASKRRPGEIIVALNRDNEQLHDLYLCNIESGELTKVAENTGFVAWAVDEDLKVRAAVQPTMEGGMNVMVRDDDESDWRLFVAFPQEDALVGGPVGFSEDGKGMYLVSSLGANSARLVRKDIASEQEEVIASDPHYDVAGALLHPDTREVQAVAFLRERLQWEVLDQSIATDFEGLQRLSAGEMNFVGRDDADKTWVVAFDSDDGPISYYVWDREAQEGRFLFVHRPELESYSLASMEPFAIEARDGTKLHGYVTFPPEGERKSLPTVLNVHGGPWHRDAWGFNPEAQWMANRGYLSIQVNFRGSTGYGKDFVNAGDREWGGKMQDDLTDTVQWAIDQGYTDPERIAIFGGSYGGYATLVGATFTPDLYCCAVSIVGPSSLKSFIEAIPPYWKPLEILFHQRVGHPETDEEFLWSRSPLSKVEAIKIPMLIAHGANDPRVKLAETEQITAAMKEKGIAHELVVFEDEGHGFAKPENRLKFYRMADKFLAEHLGGRAEG